MSEAPDDGARGWRRLWDPARGLSADDLVALDAERVALNRHRVRTAGPILAAILTLAGLVTLAVHPTDPAATRWLHGVLVIDLVGAAASLAMYLIARAPVATRLGDVRRWIGEIFQVVAVAVGAALAANTAAYQFRLDAWLIAVMIATIVVHPRAWVLVATQLAGAVAVVVACVVALPGAGARTGLISAAGAFSALLLVFARVTYAGFVREIVARRALARANQDLEGRVAAQVAEIVEHTRHIETLNRQLAGEVRARSDELAAALRRLALAEHGHGPLPPGTVVSDRFEIAHVLGVGGMGVVYAADDRLGRERVALKVVRGQLRNLADGYRFLQEASLAASLSHPAIVRVLHVDVTSDGRLYQALRLVEGRTLEAYLEAGRVLPPSITARLGAILADALATAHAAGVIHRDVKPANIMLTREPPGCCLLDFGLAKLREALPAAGLTEHGAVVGTPQFVAPEQVSTPAEVTGAADVYSLGLVLYQAVSGRSPFDAILPLQWLFAHAHTPPAPLGRDIPPTLSALIERCLAKPPDARPDARHLADALARIAETLAAPPLERWAASAAPDEPIPDLLDDLAEPSVPIAVKRSRDA